MTRVLLAFFGVGLLSGSIGCKYLPSRSSAAPPTTATGGPAPGLLIGPQGGETNSSELPQKEAIVAWLTTAHEMEKNNQPEAAIELYLKARAADPKLEASVGRRLAVLYDQVEEFTKAQAEYDAVLRATPGDPELLADLGYSYYCRGDFKRADETLRQVIHYHSEHKRAWMNLGLTQCALGKFEEGLESFRKAGSEAEARVNLAFALAVQDKKDQAIEQYRAALQLEPGMKIAKAAMAALQNPQPVRKKPVRLVDDIPPEHQIPSIHELEKRIRDAEGAKPDLPPVELKVPTR